jgi:hypothetical protein
MIGRGRGSDGNNFPEPGAMTRPPVLPRRRSEPRRATRDRFENRPVVPRRTTVMVDYLHHYWTDERIGPATAFQIAASDMCIAMAGDGKILIDPQGHLCAFGLNVLPGADIRAVFTQPDTALDEREPRRPRVLPAWFTPILERDIDPRRIAPGT